jgi:hypothetical protein
MAPNILSVRKHKGIAGQYELAVRVQYPGESVESVSFVGDVYGGPIVMVTPGIPGGVFVSPRVTDRIGTTLDTAWVHRFFGED